MTFPGTAPLLPLSPMQQGMLFHAVLNPESPAYFQQLVARLDGRLDRAAFETAWNRLVARHDALRAGFVWEGREHPAQGFAPELTVPIRHLDWRGAETATQDERLGRFLADDRTRPFALDRPPLMRVVLIETGPSAHILVWSHHHLLVDGWSTALALKEFSTLYEAAVRGVPATLPPPQSFARFLDWLAHRDPAPAREFWRRKLSGFAEPTPLGIDRKAGRAAQSAFVTLHRSLGAETVEGLRALARRLRLGPSVPVLAAWALVLARQTGGDEIVFGVTVSGRPATLDGAEELVGLMINTVPLRLRVSGRERVGDWLGDIQQRLVAVRDYDHCALASIQEWSKIPRGTPLFETIVVFENYPLGDGGAIRIGDLTVTDTRVEERANYPLALLAEPHPDGLDLALIVDCERVPEASGRAALNAVAHVIEQIATAAPDATLDTLKTLTEAERRVILQDWNATATPYDRTATLPRLFTRRAAQQPNAVALIDDAGEVTYRELDRLSDRIAARIVATGLSRDRPIGLCMRRDRHLVAAMLGVLKAGRTYVPMEPQFPPARIHHIVDVLNIGAMLHQRALSGEIAGLLAGRDVMPLVADDETAIAIPAFPAGDPDDLAYVIFTSGSTGRPKGVMVRHRPVVNLIEWVNRTFAIGPSDRLLFVTSPCFDLSVYDVFGILAAGGSVRIVDDATLADPDLLAAMFAQEPITFWDSAPAALWQVLALLPQKVPGHPLRLAFVSGDWVPLALPGRLRECFERVQPVSLGGATEATVWSNFHIVHEIDPSWVSIPYGRPIQNARYYVLDEALEPVPAGVPGDLYIGGECLADGYAQQRELSAERFLPDLHSDAPGAKMYRTGDRARFDGDGVLEFLGRLDTQVKIRGFRIELGEIESVLARHPQVREAAVIVRDRRLDDGTTERDIAAYAAPRDGETLDAAAIRAYLREHLLAPMVPAHVIPLDQLPLSANGKVDRKALPDPIAETTAPRRIADPVVDLIAQSWAAVLGIDRVPADGNFFDLGGHSLRATSAVARLRGALGADIPLRLLFEHPTPATLAAAIGRLRRQDGGDRQIATLPRNRPLPLSRAQSRLWFLHQMEPDSPYYNIALAAWATGPLEPDSLVGALRGVIARHEILRTRIEARDGMPVMVAAADAPVPLTIEDCSDRPRAEAAALETAIAAARRPFDLAKELPVRLVVAKVGAARALVLILVDHIAADGWSVGILAAELLQFYDAAVAGAQPNLPPLPAQYADWAAWHEAHLNGDVLDRELGFWRERLAGLPTMRLPTDRPRPAAPTYAGDVIRFALSPETSEALRMIAGREAATLFMVLLAGFAVVLRRLAGSDELVVGTDIAGRSHETAENLIGFFVNQLVLRLDLAGAASFRDILHRVRERALEGIFHQDTPFELLVQELNPPREAGRMPLFQVKLVLQNAPLADLASRHLQLDPVEITIGTAKYDLLMTFNDRVPLEGTLEFATDLFDRGTAETMVEAVKSVLDHVARDVEASADALARLVSLAAEERAAFARQELRRAGLARLRTMRRETAS
jgi:amino acid adenylation domain-containing protein